jgi:hypothetical protein
VTIVAPVGSGLVRWLGSLGEDLPGEPHPPPGDLDVGLTVTAGGVSAKLFFQAPPDQARRMKALLPGGGGALVRFLPADAAVVARVGSQPVDVLRDLRRIPELAQLSARLGEDVSNEIAAALLPGGALSVDLAPRANLAALVDLGLADWRRRSPFDTFQIVMLAPVGDRPRLERALDKAGRALSRLGTLATRNGTGWQVHFAGGEGPRFGIRELDGRPVAFLVGGGITPEQLAAGPQRPAIVQQDAGASLQIDFARLAAHVRALPESSYGSGPQAYVARSVVSQVVDPLGPIRVTVAAVPQDDGLRGEIDLAIAPGTP